MMLTEAATKLGFEITVIDSTPNCPAKQAGAKQIVADLHDREALQQLADSTDVITIEIEHVDTEFLAELSKLGKPVYPKPEVIKTIQDKYTQKQHLSELNLPVAEFEIIKDIASAEAVLDKFGGRMILKRRLGGFDGRGNAVVSSQAELEQAFEALGKENLYAEKLIDFSKELAVIAARSINGQTSIFPVVETIQTRNICQEVYAPAKINAELTKNLEEIAKSILDSYDTAGVFGIEMFLDQNGQVLINEIAPRVHNSGHYTIEGCETSQFEQHLRSIAGLPLGDTKLTHKAAVMVNILGEHAGDFDNRVADLQQFPNTFVHLYGKTISKIDRKMGHVTSVADDFETALANARGARASIKV